MGALTLLLGVLPLLLVAPTHGQLVSMVTPAVLRLETEEKVLVEAPGLSSKSEVTLLVQDFPRKRQVLHRDQLTLTPQQGMMATGTIKVSAKALPKEGEKQFVSVTARVGQVTLEKVLLVSLQSGHIFIQTDKPIYTPDSTVLCRFFTVNHLMQPVSKMVIVEIKTPDDVIIKQEPLIAPLKTGIFSLNHYLPEIVSMGMWTITARFEDSPEQVFSTQFEVKEYVLPSFEVTLDPHEKFLYIDQDKEFKVSITARYLYGKKLQGTAFVLFGVMVDDEKKSIPQSLQRVQVVDGDAEAVLPMEMLNQRFANRQELVGHSLYVSATVLTDSGSDMVEVQRGGIRIVTSPYTIHFSHTSTYFKPGMPFDLTVYVTNPDGSPAARVPVKAEGFQGLVSTKMDGTATLVLNMPANKDSVPITVLTDKAGLPANRQASRQMTAQAYRSQGGSGNFLHLAVGASELKPGDNLPVTFHLKSNSKSVLNSVKHFTYLIMTKGRIVKVGQQHHEPGQDMVIMMLPITAELIPSFRIVAYYSVMPGEIVADSVWVDVKDTCMGSLVVKEEKGRGNLGHEPGSQVQLHIEGDHNAHVGLVVVDKGVYVLNKNKITQSKVWDTVEKSDIGCTRGSGRDNVGVFADAGLSLTTNKDISTPQRGEVQCPQPAKRRRRSLKVVEAKGNKLAEYKDKVLRKCCEDGMKDNPMGHSCERRATYIQDGEACVQAFLDCCTHIKSVRDQNQRQLYLQLARSEDEDIFMDADNIISRSHFPESWLWLVEQLTNKPNENGISSKVLPFYLKDSITTWEVLAISLSESKGLCVADPYEITVVKQFFIDLRLPYSVVRNEQVEIRAVLYNYWTNDITVRIELMYNPALCSASTSKRRYQQILKVRAESSRAVPFVIVPLHLGLHDIEVKASVQNKYVSDGVKKKLKVVAEGMRMEKTVKIVELHPKEKGINGEQKEKVLATDLSDMVPNTKSETRVSITGDPVSVIVEKAIDGAKMKHLIVTPSGCGEQNMIGMTPTVIATHYLDSTLQWETFGIDRRAHAIELINRGYARQLTYRKSDLSYAAFINRKSSTWLTAYVAKVFAMAISLVDIDPKEICGPVKWLILNRQKPDGVFQEEGPVIHTEMVGGYDGAEPEVSLTAFVLVALLESREVCKDLVNNLDEKIDLSASYLSRRYQHLARPYTVALTSYALALAGKLKSEKLLMKFSKENNRWEERDARTFNIEGTSYALLALLQMEKTELTGPVARWLAQQNYFGGGYGSTQATVLVFQALAKYQVATPKELDINLDVSILLPRRAKAETYRIQRSNALVARSAETEFNEAFEVTARGAGKGKMTVVTIYNAKVPEKENKCDNFNLKVNVEEVRTGREQEGIFRSVKITICTRYLKEVDATMSIIDVSMLTGFSPDVEDLRRLTEGVDRYFSKYEINHPLSERNNIVIYLDKISHTEEECFAFKAHQNYQVGLIQPASVTVYSYYKIDDRCTQFYHPDKSGGKFSKLCHGDVCHCAEESCFMRREDDQELTVNQRIENACQPGVDYVYRMKVLAVELMPSQDNYITSIVSVIKAGTDEVTVGSNRTFISHQQCREALKLQVDQDYLIWGLTNDLWASGRSYHYVIGKDTWLEAWPAEDACQEPDLQKLCQDFTEFSEAMTMFGCLN